MISGEKIATLIRDPRESSETYLGDLESLVEKYPYCSSLYILALKGAANSGSVGFEDKLKNAAAHVADRAHLFNIINDSSPNEISNSELEQAETMQTEANPVSTEEVVAKEPVIEKEVLAETPIEKSKLSEKVSEDEKVESDENLDSASEELNTDILSHAVSVAFEHSAESVIPIDENETSEEEVESKLKESIEPANDLSSEKPISEVNRSTENLTFIQWLQLKKTKSSAADSSKESEDKAADSFNLEIKESSKSEINDLLDKFISEEPSISKPNKAFYSPSENAKKSLEESTDIVSETLAKIHVMQGNYSKATAAYKQLILLYPEKKAFFASQIEKIKQKQSQ